MTALVAGAAGILALAPGTASGGGTAGVSAPAPPPLRGVGLIMPAPGRAGSPNCAQAEVAISAVKAKPTANAEMCRPADETTGKAFMAKTFVALSIAKMPEGPF